MKEVNQKFAEAVMLIRKPASEVFNAFINPVETTNFWFTKSSGRLELGKTVTWEWEMYSIKTIIRVKEIIPDEKIVMDWGEPATTVEYVFTSLTADTTYVVIKNYGFEQSGDELIAVIRDSTGGFTTVLDGLKAYLEHNIKLNLVGDKFPKEVSDHGK